MRYFYCYSYKLMSFLKLQGHHFICKSYHPNGRPYWIFQNYESELDKDLQKWDDYKKFIKGGPPNDRQAEVVC